MMPDLVREPILSTLLSSLSADCPPSSVKVLLFWKLEKWEPALPSPSLPSARLVGWLHLLMERARPVGWDAVSWYVSASVSKHPLVARDPPTSCQRCYSLFDFVCVASLP
jgi:hypothetical protein